MYQFQFIILLSFLLLHIASCFDFTVTWYQSGCATIVSTSTHNNFDCLLGPYTGQWYQIACDNQFSNTYEVVLFSDSNCGGSTQVFGFNNNGCSYLLIAVSCVISQTAPPTTLPPTTLPPTTTPTFPSTYVQIRSGYGACTGGYSSNHIPQNQCSNVQGAYGPAFIIVSCNGLGNYQLNFYLDAQCADLSASILSYSGGCASTGTQVGAFECVVTCPGTAAPGSTPLPTKNLLLPTTLPPNSLSVILYYYSNPVCATPAVDAFLSYSGYCQPDNHVSPYLSSFANCNALTMTYYTNANCTGTSIAYTVALYGCTAVGGNRWIDLSNCPGTTKPPTTAPPQLSSYQTFTAAILDASSTCLSHPSTSTIYFKGIIGYCMYTGKPNAPAIQIFVNTNIGAGIVYTVLVYTDAACAISAGPSFILTSGVCQVWTSAAGVSLPIYIYIQPRFGAYTLTYDLVSASVGVNVANGIAHQYSVTSIHNTQCVAAVPPVSSTVQPGQDPNSALFYAVRPGTVTALCFDDGSYIAWAYQSQSCSAFSTLGNAYYYIQSGITPFVTNDQAAFNTSITCSNSNGITATSPYMYEFIQHRPTTSCNPSQWFDITTRQVLFDVGVAMETGVMYKSVGVSNQCNPNVGDGLNFNSIQVICNYTNTGYSLLMYSDSQCKNFIYSAYGSNANCNMLPNGVPFSVYCRVIHPITNILLPTYTVTKATPDQLCQPLAVNSTFIGYGGICTAAPVTWTFKSIMVYCVDGKNYIASVYYGIGCTGIPAATYKGDASTCSIVASVSLQIQCHSIAVDSSSGSSLLIDWNFVEQIFIYIAISIAGICALCCTVAGVQSYRASKQQHAFSKLGSKHKPRNLLMTKL